MYTLNNNGIYEATLDGPKMLPSGGASLMEKQRDLMLMFEKSATQLIEMGYLEGFTPKELIDRRKEYEKLTDYEKGLCGLINVRMFGSYVKCPMCGKRQTTSLGRVESVKFRGSLVNVGWKKCYECNGDLYYWIGYKYGTKKPRLSSKDMLKKRDEYLIKIKEKQDIKRKMRAKKLKKRGPYVPGDFGPKTWRKLYE